MPDEMTQARRGEIRARAEAATAGPLTWVNRGGYYELAQSVDEDGYPVGVVMDDGSAGGEYSGFNTDGPDMVLFANAQADVSDLLAALEASEKREEALRSAAQAYINAILFIRHNDGTAKEEFAWIVKRGEAEKVLVALLKGPTP